MTLDIHILEHSFGRWIIHILDVGFEVAPVLSIVHYIGGVDQEEHHQTNKHWVGGLAPLPSDVNEDGASHEEVKVTGKVPGLNHTLLVGVDVVVKVEQVGPPVVPAPVGFSPYNALPQGTLA